MSDGFLIVLRGYDRPQVDQLLEQARTALAAGSAGRRAEAKQALETAALPIRLRGYDRRGVDEAFTALIAQLG